MHDKVDGNLDTVMHLADFREFNQISNLAPGEGNVPLSLYEDKDAEYLAFPTVYASTSRDYSRLKVPIYYSQVVKWELRNIDRRVATNVPLIFFKMEKFQIKLMRDKVSLAVKKFKSRGKKLTAGEVIEPGGIDKLVKFDEGQRGMSTLLSDASRKAKDRASGVRDQVRSVCNKFLTHVEIGVQEAVYLLLQIPLRKSSRAVKFIKTSPPDERTVLLKSIDVLEKMAKNSTDIETDNILQQYTRRPKVLENVCLADYVAWFEMKNFKKKCNIDFNLDSENPENDDSVETVDIHVEKTITTDHNDTSYSSEQFESNISDAGSSNITLIDQLPKEIELKNGLKLVKRRLEKVIRYVRFNIDIDRENHFRENIFLFFTMAK
ncbi:unnamed protein product [Mytilus coruscus]|uniref:Uncharacterized protein n=1 Tax=Mytilus coruscus TaxID=42192 RepID=A0A6J8AP89_MYTCO|nr:unnamed protein product [Mytilus coruscus]